MKNFIVPNVDTFVANVEIPLCWSKLDDKRVLGLEIIQETIIKIRSIQKIMKVAQSLQKCYAYHKKSCHYLQKIK